MPEAVHPTGLIKICPRCGRKGVVAHEDSEFRIDWEKGETTLLVTMEELLNPEFGCGDYSVGPYSKAP